MEEKQIYEPNPPVGAAAAIARDSQQRAPFTIFVVAPACGIADAFDGAKVRAQERRH